MAIAKATHNDYHVSVQTSLHPHIAFGMNLTRNLSLLRTAERLRIVQDEHRAIVEAIAARDADAARTAMQNHIDNARRRMFEGAASMTVNAGTTPTDKQDATDHWTSRWLANPYLLLAVASLFWSGNHIVGRAAGGHVPPMAISTARWLIPAILMWPLARHHLKRDWPDDPRALENHAVAWPDRRRAVYSAAICRPAIYQRAQCLGAELAGAGADRGDQCAVVPRSHHQAAIGRHRHLVVRRAGDHRARTNSKRLPSLAFNWGDLIIVVNMMLFAVYAAYLRLRPRIHWLSFLFVLAVISSAVTFPLFIWESLHGYPLQPTLMTFATIGYIAIFPSLLAFAAWNRGVELIGANRAGPFLHLVPIYTAVLASTLLGEHMAAYHVVGFVLIIAGVWLASKAGKLPGNGAATPE